MGFDYDSSYDEDMDQQNNWEIIGILESHIGCTFDQIAEVVRTEIAIQLDDGEGIIDRLDICDATVFQYIEDAVFYLAEHRKATTTGGGVREPGAKLVMWHPPLAL